MKLKLNQSQYEAVIGALTRRLTLIQGPPGTGNTYTAIEILTTMVKHKVGPILATADCLNGSIGERRLSSFDLPSFEKTKENDKIKIVQKFFILIKIYPYKEVYFPWR